MTREDASRLKTYGFAVAVLLTVIAIRAAAVLPAWRRPEAMIRE
jgi:hypothetical protein